MDRKSFLKWEELVRVAENHFAEVKRKGSRKNGLADKFGWANVLHKPLINDKFYVKGIRSDNKYVVLNLKTEKLLFRTSPWVSKQFGRV